MKNYLLFAGETCYPKGGINDFKGNFNTIEEGEKMFYDNTKGMTGWDWYQIVERETLKVIMEMY